MTAAPTSGPPVTAPPGALALDPGWVTRLTSFAVTSPRAATMTTVTPMSGRPLARLPLSSAQDVEVALAGARSAHRFWSLLPMSARCQILLRFHDLLLTRQVEMLDLIQLESGKARGQAFEEVVDAAQVARHYARQGPAYLQVRRRPGALPVLTHVVERRLSKGVVGLVTPASAPLMLGLSDALPAMLAGNTIVWRPDAQGALTALFAAELLARAGLPQRVLQVVLGDGPTIGRAVLDHADYLSFTGSVAVGREVAQRAALRLAGASLHLGGKNAMYVAADADLDRAARRGVRACFTSAGQSCPATERVILHEAIADPFLARFLPQVRALRVGRQLTYDADMGGLGSAAQLDRVTRHVADAVAKGARVRAGGRARPDLGPWFHEPTVLDGVTVDMAVFAEETFGPVVSVFRVPDDAHALALANDTTMGMGASVWTTDRRRGRSLAAALRVGSVTINDGPAASLGSVAAPMGGMKESGGGRRHGAEGILRFTDAQIVARQRAIDMALPTGVAGDRVAVACTAGLRLLRALGRP
jgi:succinate-semialdehyde dehydrogenase/glutarate-semialdehyde dehydrogenase